MLTIAVTVVGLYGLFSLIGGIIGYTKAQSAASFIAGTSSGAVLFLCAYGLRQANHLAAVMSLLVALLLGGRFFRTWRTKRRVMPDLLMVLFSAATLLTVGAALLVH